MKRRTPLARGRGPKAGNPLRRTNPLRPSSNRLDKAGSPKRLPSATSTRTVEGFSLETRLLIVNRDSARCQRCGVQVSSTWPGYSLQHRDSRAMGGSNASHTNRPGNGIVLCGSGTTGCHGWVESHPRAAQRNGWAVASWADPTTVPVHAADGWALIDHDGARRPIPAPLGGDAHAVASRKGAP